MRGIVIILMFLGCGNLAAQTDVYTIDWRMDAPIIGVGLGLNVASFLIQSNWDAPSQEEIMALNSSDVWSFDRSAIDNRSPDAKTISDIILYSSAVFPVLTYLSDDCRCEGADVAIMGLETLIVITGITEMTKTFARRYRPFVYDPTVPLQEKLTVNSQKSFFSGHTSVTAATSFFVAKVFHDLHPEWKNKGWLWATAAAIPASIGYFRYKAGKHFPSDVITGYIMGAAVGYLIPAIHKNPRLNIIPTGTSSVSLYYRF